MSTRFVRLAEHRRATVKLWVDGEPTRTLITPFHIERFASTAEPRSKAS